ncbi:hypothetical protein SUGI_0369820 [Cryptomeria japonica]|uniref:putative disease resistance protein At3g14460 n=1 Tax=Cryptomeria japonica TaxID=3369 RepID=UPI002408D7AB|nr:putative disease resistance protein At3g14460 [Cryptomeria japonica]GLJ20366.1 hypothetical protein SUGI_0369820 [Cryptomeria japonica]
MGDFPLQQVDMQLSLPHFEEAFQWLKTHLAHVRDFFKYADDQNIWETVNMDAILRIADEADDIECEIEYMSSNATHSYVMMYRGLIFRWRMLRRIKKIQDSLRSIINEEMQFRLYYENSDLSRIASKSNSPIPLQMSSVLQEEDSYAVGMEHKITEIVSVLENPSVSVIAVVGMGGLGKAFLVRRVYRSVKEEYDYLIWLRVSRSYSILDLQRLIALQIEDRGIVGDNLSEKQAADWIYGRLQLRIWFIVLDGVRHADEDFLTRLGIPTSHHRKSKVVITTRNMDVCSKLKAFVYKMEALSFHDSWKFFCAYAFHDTEENRPPEDLEELAESIVAECGGLPLALKTVAASLSRTRDPVDLRSVLRHLKQADTQKDRVMQALKLSYDSLSPIQKSCFTFLSFFSEGKVIDVEDLISLWIGEGLIPQVENKRDKARECLKALANSSLLEVYNTSDFRSYCQMEKSLLNLAKYVSRKSRCVFSLEEYTERGSDCRRILLGSKAIDGHAIENSSVANAKSVSTFSLCNNNISLIPNQLFVRMKVLRILDLSGTGISMLPDSVANLKLLRVLNLCSTKIEQVPNCIRKITSLRFLNIAECKKLTRLPEWICQLKYLEHLNVAGCSDELASYMPAGISKLLSLQVFASDYLNFSIQDSKLLKLEHVASLIRLENLCINVNHREELEAIVDGVLAQLVELRCLRIANEIPPMLFENEPYPPPFPVSMAAMENVEKLFLWNFDVPSWVCGFQKLRVIEICGNCSSYPELETMPSLECLFLFHNHKCTALPPTFGESSGFQKLRFLEISEFPLLEELPEFDDRTMPRLEKLSINSCTSLKKVPDGLEHLKRLKRIQVSASPVIRSALEGGGVYRTKIKANNPNVVIDLL